MDNMVLTRTDIERFVELASLFSRKTIGRMFEGESPDGNMALLPEVLNTSFVTGLAASTDPSSPGHETGVWGMLTDQAGVLHSLLMLSAVAEACAGVAMCLNAQGAASNILMRAQSKLPFRADRAMLCMQEGPYPPLCGGSLSGEENSAHAIASTAVPHGNDYVLKGTKRYAYGMPDVDTLVVVARTGNGWGCFAVPANADGVTITDEGPRTGLRACALNSIILNNVKVSGAARIDAGDARELAFRAYALMWYGMAAIAGGAARGAVKAARSYAAQRYQGCGIIDTHPAMKMLMGGAEAKAEGIMRMLTAADRPPLAGIGPLASAAEAKLAATRLAGEAVTDCLQVFGGYGYMEDFGMEKRLRDVTVLRTSWGPPMYLEQLVSDIRRGEA